MRIWISQTTTVQYASFLSQVLKQLSTVEHVARLPADTVKKNSQLTLLRSMRQTVTYPLHVSSAKSISQGLNSISMKVMGARRLPSAAYALILIPSLNSLSTRTIVGNHLRYANSAEIHSLYLMTSTNTKLQAVQMPWSASIATISSPEETWLHMNQNVASLITAPSAWMSSDWPSCRFMSLNAHSLPSANFAIPSSLDRKCPNIFRDALRLQPADSVTTSYLAIRLTTTKAVARAQKLANVNTVKTMFQEISWMTI